MPFRNQSKVSHMEESVILQNLTAIITRYCKKEGPAQLEEHLRFVEDLGVNSARLVDIVLDIEDKFGISISDELADKISTVGDALQLIQEKTAEAN